VTPIRDEPGAPGPRPDGGSRVRAVGPVPAVSPLDERHEGRGLPALSRALVSPVPEPLFDRGESVVVVVGQLAGDPARVVRDPGDESHPVGLGGVYHPAREREVERVRRGNRRRETDGPAPRAEQADPDPALGERRRRRRDPEVTGERQLDPATACRAVDAGDDDGVGPRDGAGGPLPQPCECGGLLALEVVDHVEVGPGTERRSGAPQVDNRRPGGPDRGPQLLEGRGGQGVAPLGTRERYHLDRSVGLGPDHVTHGRPVSKGLWTLVAYPYVMDEAATCRRAARGAVRDIDPPELRDAIVSAIDDGSMMPGALAILTARAAAGDDLDVDAVAERAAGVQLIYEGLSSIRELAATEPWDGVDPDVEDVDEQLTGANIAVLAADVAVARGFYLLARTDAAGKAVETVRAFGRDQTLAGSGDRTADGTLEVDVLELAVITGATSVGADPTAELISRAGEIARDAGTPFPPADAHLPEPAEFGPDVDARAGATDGGTKRTATDP